MARKTVHFKTLIAGAIVLHGLSGLTFAWLIFAYSPLSARAQSVSPDSSPLSRQLRFTPPDFSDVGRPARRTGGGSRGSCFIPDMSPLTALVPDTNVGLTLAESPTFWFYVPYTLTSEHAIEFVLKDEQDNIVYTTKFPGKGTSPGIVSLRLPSTISLEANKNYEWYFLIYCDAQNQERFVYVNGSVQRIERPDLETQLAAASPEEKIALYAIEGIWYEALTYLAEQRHTSPQDSKINEDWTSLLQSVGLESLASEPFVSCCSPEN
ncbi:MAG: DUF928 domain-containing protein [Cyanobacteria bacterium CRU_2_1]|nr:DUF928 domain-containing protein [Cyanobacteria bacterium RU_5_0]NJR61645.1 DUF928 domain-containing protein [Cyanobacteria bacterium CRU_2_1]